MNPMSSRAAGALLAIACGYAHAQPTGQLAPVVITGNPLGASDLAAPADSLSGTELLLKSQSSLGETLHTLPGVSSTYFGPAASRPVIRGLDGDRIRILNNSGSLPDVSSLSYDHAVAADPITVERIEVLRGPAALLYGGSAIGGVVNLIDNRIPREPLPGPTGKADIGYASGSRESTGAVLVEGGTQRWAIHADAFARHAADVRVPVVLGCEQGGVTRWAARICNSRARASGGALGGSVFFDDGFIGLSSSRFGSHYGAVSEDEVAIRMRSMRHALHGEWRRLPGLVQQVKLQASHGEYRHAEEEGGAVGTVFRQRSTDLRLELRHRSLGPVEGVWGLQLDAARFSAEGDEAFAPPSRTKQVALFAFEQWSTGWGRLTAGLRGERVHVESFDSAGVPRFTAQGRSFSPLSGAVGLVWNVAPEWRFTANLAHTERAPKDYELFADGAHVATGAYETGDALLGVERSRNAEAIAQWSRGRHKLRFGVYASRFSNYIALTPMGSIRDELPEFAYRATRASFRGFEAEAAFRLLDASSSVDLVLRADAVRARDEVRDEPLARIAPARLGAGLTWSRGAWTAAFGADRYASQQRVPAGALATPGYTLVRATLTWRTEVKGTSLLWFAKVDNAADRLAYSATSILTQTAPGRVPLPGRSVRLGLRADF